MSRILAVTGASGFLGRRVMDVAAETGAWDEIHGLDIVKPPEDTPHVRFSACDVTEPFGDLLRRLGATDAIHLAFQVDPKHNLAGMRRLNVGGCENFLAACAEAGVDSAVVVSSATAYGALPDNPDLLLESHALRASSRFPYAWHKAEAERACDRFLLSHPAARLAIARPCVVLGPNMDNYLSRMTLRPVVFGVWGSDPAVQLIHESDVARGIVALSESRARGPFNLAPADTVRYSQIACGVARPMIRLPGPVLTALTGVAWKLRLRWLSEVPAGFLDYIRYPWCVDNTRLVKELGFRFHFTTRQALDDWVRSLDSPQGQHAHGTDRLEKTAA